MSVQLQWGHNFDVMEMNLMSHTRYTSSLSFNGAITLTLWKCQNHFSPFLPLECFNGAITLTLWKLDVENGNQFRHFALQWGHNFDVMEISLCLLYLWYTSYRFNGAITLTLWKLDMMKQTYTADKWLQWGHNFDVMEIDTSFRMRHKIMLLQWGHNFDVMEIA